MGTLGTKVLPPSRLGDGVAVTAVGDGADGGGGSSAPGVQATTSPVRAAATHGRCRTRQPRYWKWCQSQPDSHLKPLACIPLTTEVELDIRPITVLGRL